MPVPDSAPTLVLEFDFGLVLLLTFVFSTSESFPRRFHISFIDIWQQVVVANQFRVVVVLSCSVRDG